MENITFHGKDSEQIKLPPGFRFHPTDEELITYYLSPKSLHNSFCAKAIGEVDLNKVEPWDLPRRAKMGEREFYFFCMRDRKYPTGLRTNRATDAGFWKATGKDKEIFVGKNLIGMKKTLVFYRGRAPKGEKTNWVMHEYRLEGGYNSPTTPIRNEWVISRIFQKSSDGKKVHISNLERMRSYENVLHQLNSTPLMDLPGSYDQRRPTTIDHMNFFFEPMDELKSREEIVDSSYNSYLFTKSSVSDLIVSTQFTPKNEMVQDQSMMRYYLPNDGNLTVELPTEREIKTNTGLVSSGHEMDQESDGLSYSRGPVDLDCLWHY